MKLVYPNWQVPSNVHAISTTRLTNTKFSDVENLKSKPRSGLYDHFNLGLHVDDDRESVLRNRTSLVEVYSLPGTPGWLNQTHSTDVVRLDGRRDCIASDGSLLNADGSLLNADGSPYNADGSPYNADGSITNQVGQVCVVMTADCLPLLLTNRQGTEVAAVHAGWRGMAEGIIENAVAQVDCNPSDIIAWAGPCIGPKHFEIGLEVKQQLGGLSSHYTLLANDKALADLYAICGYKLAQLGVSHYSHSSACTFADEHLFYSFRRDGQCGRMATLIWLD